MWNQSRAFTSLRGMMVCVVVQYSVCWWWLLCEVGDVWRGVRKEVYYCMVCGCSGGDNTCVVTGAIDGGGRTCMVIAVGLKVLFWW